MRSFRVHGGVALVALGLLAGVAKGQVYGPSIAYQRLPAPTDTTNDTAPPAYYFGQSSRTDTQPDATVRSVPFGLSSLIGPPPVQQVAPTPLPRVTPHQDTAPSPSGLFSYGSPVQQYTPMAGQKYSSDAACDKDGKLHAPSESGSKWFGGVYGLFMTRDNENSFNFSFDTDNEARQLTNSRDANFDTAGGFGIEFGRYFNCGRNAIQAVYWGVFPGEGSTTTTRSDVGGALWGIQNWNDLTYNGQNADVWVNGVGGAGASAHTIWRDNEFHNVEINLLDFFGYCPQSASRGSRLSVNWLAGVRYFNFKDELLFGSDTSPSGQFTYDDPTEIYYSVATNNYLVGFQLGAEGEYHITPRLSLDFGVKYGVFGNSIEHDSSIGGSAGNAVINNGPFAGQPFVVESSKTDAAMLGELDLGLAYNVTHRWKAIAGYRLVGVTGVALPTNQIYPDLRGLNDVQLVDSNGSLILHGGYGGLEYNY
ncbi:MAG: BBP7 family outer membrane beta-barrel protein [Pirellulaceae bacterium]